MKIKDIYKLQQDVEILKSSISENNFETDWGNLPKTPFENAPITQIIFPENYTNLEYCVIHKRKVNKEYLNCLITNLQAINITSTQFTSFSALFVYSSSEKYKNFTKHSEGASGISFSDILELETNSIRLINILKSKKFPENKLLITKTSGTQSIKANVSILKGETSSLNEYKGIKGELVANIETNTIHLMDGKTFGGIELSKKSDIEDIKSTMPIINDDATSETVGPNDVFSASKMLEIIEELKKNESTEDTREAKQIIINAIFDQSPNANLTVENTWEEIAMHIRIIGNIKLTYTNKIIASKIKKINVESKISTTLNSTNNNKVDELLQCEKVKNILVSNNETISRSSSINLNINENINCIKCNSIIASEVVEINFQGE